MNTQTQPSLREPKTPSDIALDTEDSSRMDVCTAPNSNHPEWVSIYIRNPSIDMDRFLKKVTGLETRLFPCNPLNLRERFLDSMNGTRPIVDEKKSDDSYVLRYNISEKNKVYDAVRRL